jgi:hypothetical protein
MQQMMEMLLKEIKAGQEENRINQEKMEAKLDADRKTDKEEIKTGHKELLAKMEANRKPDQEKAEADRARTQEMMNMLQAYQAKTDAVLPAMQVTETSHKETAAVFEPETEVKTMACQGMEAHQEEEKPASLDMKPEVAQQEEVPVEDAEVIPVGELKKKRRRDRKLAAERRRQKTNTSTQENYGPQKRLAVAHTGSSRCGRVTRHMKETDQKVPRRATVARCIRDIFKPNMTPRAAVARCRRNAFKKETTQGNFRCQRKKLAIENCLHRLWKQPYDKPQPLRDDRSSAKKPDLKKVQMESKGNFDINSTKTTRLDFAKQMVRSTGRLKKINNWTLWRGRPPPKRKKGKGPYGRNRW